MSENPFRKAIASRQQVEPEVSEPIAESTQLPQTESAPILEPKKRGRPATGKRSDDAWIGRTFYIQKETDLDVEDELLNLRRQGIELDKSELIDKILIAWVKWRQGENSEILLSEISPRRKSKNLL